jgi:hypothetical protein
MDPFAAVDVDTLLAGTADWSDDDLLEQLAAHPLDCLDTEYPHHAGAVESPEDPPRPSERHPVFYGCFDWHSSVHSHWALVRALRLFDDHPNEAAVVEDIDERLTAEAVDRECERFADDDSFENPYGWGWFLRLAAELHLWDDSRADDWRETLAPLEDRITDLVDSEFLTQDRPFRVGTHGNSAFALACVHDYARVVGDDELAADTAETTRRFYAADTDYPIAYEPLGWDFVSPALTEADLLRRVLDGPAYRTWLDDFLPGLAERPGETLPDPVAVADDEGGVALHLVGLNLARAWCLAGVADAVPDHPAADALSASARDHAERGIESAFTDDYAGAHWLSSFVLYLLTRNAGGIAP